MTPTIAWINNQISIWNQKAFRGELPQIKVVLTRARSYSGKMICKRHSYMGAKKQIAEYTLRLSLWFDHTEDEHIDTIIHELIHAEIFHKRLKDTSSHGEVFQRRMNEINRIFGRNITISERVNVNPDPIEEPLKRHYICLVKFHDGRYGVARMARTRLFDVWNLFATVQGVKQVKWIYTVDNFFNKYPLSRKAQLYKIEAEEVKQHLIYKMELINDGRTIRLGETFDVDRWMAE